MSCLKLLPQRAGWIADLTVRYETRLFPCPVLRQLQAAGFTLHTVDLDLGRLLRVMTPTDGKVRSSSRRIHQE